MPTSSTDNVPLDETPARPAGSLKARRGSPDRNGAREEKSERDPAVVEAISVEEVADEAFADEAVVDEMMTRDESLLLATLRVWELKQGMTE